MGHVAEPCTVVEDAPTAKAFRRRALERLSWRATTSGHPALPVFPSGGYFLDCVQLDKAVAVRDRGKKARAVDDDD